MTPWMKSDLARILAVLGTVLLAGFISGWMLTCLLIGIVVLIVWYYRSLRGLLDFIKHSSEDNLAGHPGIVNELTREFERLRRHYLNREEKLTGFLNRFEETAAAMPDAVVVTDSGGRIEWANKKAEEYLGLEWPRDRGQRLSNLIRYPGIAGYLAKNSEELRSSPLEIVSPVDPGQRLEFRVNRYGNTYMLFVARDITEIHRLNRVRKDFIANASHELRTPLTVITGYLESFEEDPDSCPEGWRPQITQMREQARRMQRLIEDLLTLSSLESADEPAPEEEVRVADMLDSIVSEARTLSGDQGHIFETDADPSVLLLGSRRDLYSAFSNVVFNAVQYTPAGGKITVHWYRDQQGAACLQVTDTGEGISEEHIPRITERFYRVDKGRSRSRGGTGLGLAIVKHVLARHDARLEVRSTPGEGSTFACHFPPERVTPRRQSSPGVSVTA